jgi:uncharacterized protein (UPF0335 family)
MSDEKIGGNAAEKLRSLVERVERLEEEKKSLVSDIREIYAEAKGDGFDVKIIRKLVTLRRLESEVLEEQRRTIELYADALGMDCFK